MTVSPLLQALYEGRREDADAMLATDRELDPFEAAAVGRVDRLGDDPHAWSPDGFQQLHLASFFGRPEAVRALLDRGADPNVRARHELIRVFPIHSAAAADSLEIVRLLVERGADVNARQEGGFTALHAAAQNRNEAMRDYLLEHGADPDAATDDGRTAPDL